MQQIDIDTDDQKSRIFIDSGSIERAGILVETRSYGSVFVIVDKTVESLILDKLMKTLPSNTQHFAVPSGEKAKHIGTVQDIWKAMHEAGCDRKSLVINLGGGVLCDIGGFAASTYMRGVDFVHVPTTLLAQVDASIGGKTSVNFDGVKNLVGTFSQPVAVVIDPAVLTTLPPREFVAGFGEIIKHGLITGRDYLAQATKKLPLDFTAEELESIIEHSCRIKADIVGDDSKESGMRKAVNFGHTVGHAVEALSLEAKHPLLHGEAVAIGMVVEVELSHRSGMLSEADVQLVRQSVTKAGLPAVVPKLSTDRIMKIMRSDKKNQAGSIRFTLLESIGKAVYDQEVNPEIVRQVIEETMEQ